MLRGAARDMGTYSSPGPQAFASVQPAIAPSRQPGAAAAPPAASSAAAGRGDSLRVLINRRPRDARFVAGTDAFVDDRNGYVLDLEMSASAGLQAVAVDPR